MLNVGENDDDCFLGYHTQNGIRGGNMNKGDWVNGGAGGKRELIEHMFGGL